MGCGRRYPLVKLAPGPTSWWTIICLPERLFKGLARVKGLLKLLYLCIYPRGHDPTEEFQPQGIVYTSRVHFLNVGLHEKWDSFPVEATGPFGHAFDSLLRRLSSCCRSSKLPHHFDKELWEAVFFQLRSPLPPFTSGSPNMSRCYVRACRRVAPRGS